VAGYNIYRAPGGSTSYQRINSSLEMLTDYSDATVQGGSTYVYMVKSVDGSGVESAPSNTTTVTVP
jgi:fibronectin type 3 domain-containing protein